MNETTNQFFYHKILKRIICCMLIVGLVCSNLSGQVVLAAESETTTPTIRLYMQKPEDWTTPAIHVWNEEAVIKSDGTIFIESWNADKPKLYKDSSNGLYYVDVTLKSWYGFQFINAETGKDIRIDKDVDTDAKVLAAFTQMTKDTSVYYLNKNGTYGWYMDAAGTKTLDVPSTIYANIHFYNEQEWETPCIDAWVSGVTTQYSNVGSDTNIKGWDHTLPAMKAEEENWYTATIQVTGKLNGMQFVDAKTGNMTILNPAQLEIVDTCVKETATDLYYGYGVLSSDKKEIPIPKKLVKRKSPVYNADGTVTFHLATEEKSAGIKGTFTNWLTTPMEAISDAEDGFIGFTSTMKVPTEGGIYTYGMVTGEDDLWIGDPENKTQTDNPTVIRNPEIGNETVTIYWPSTEDTTGTVNYRKYGSKDTYSKADLQPVADAKNLFAAVIKDAEAGETYEYTIEINGTKQEDIYNFASKKNEVSTFIASKKITEPDYESPVINEDGTVTFHYWNPSAKEVKLAGDMTAWASDAVYMKKDENNGLFSVTIPVLTGTYGYKFIVDGNWVLDPKNSKTTEGTDISSLLEISAKATPEPTTGAVITPTAPVTTTPKVTTLPAITPSMVPTATPTITPTATVTPTATATPTITITPTATVVPTATATPVTTVTPTPIVTPSVAPSFSPLETATPVPTETVTPSAIPSIAPTASAKPAEPSSYRITYVLNKGKNHKSNPISYKTKNVTLKAPTRAGYMFGGWYTNKTMTKRITTIKASLKKNITIYAKWNKVQKPSAVKGISLTNKKGGKIKITFKKVSGVKGYEILYAKDKKCKKSPKKVYVTGTTKTLQRLKKKQIYYVKVRAYKIDSTGKKVYGSYSSVKKIRITK